MAGLPDPGMKIDPENTALLITDPQNDFLSPEGVMWGVVGKNVEETNTGIGLFCMTSIHYFGVTTRFLGHLLRYLKKGGRFSVGNTCFDREIPPDQVPDIYRTTPPGNILDGWESECSRYHSPRWWRRLFDDSEIVKVIECVELEDGPAMWEDNCLPHELRPNPIQRPPRFVRLLA